MLWLRLEPILLACKATCGHNRAGLCEHSQHMPAYAGDPTAGLRLQPYKQCKELAIYLEGFEAKVC